MNPRTKRLINLGIILVTFGIVLYIVLSDPSLPNALKSLTNLRIQHIAVLLLCWALYVLGDAVSIWYCLRRQGYKLSLPYVYFTSICCQYYCGITPGATGGQPMQIYYIHKKGVPTGIASSALIVHFFCFQRPDPADNAVRGRLSLNDGRVQDNLNIGIAPSCNLNDITDSRTGGGGDNTQAPDKGRNGLFIGRIEHSLLQELLFQLFEAFRQCANAVTDDLVGVELVASCLCVYIHGAGNNDLITVLHVKRKPPSTACEHDAGQRPGGIF
jgi:hypothetical protein